MKNKNLKVRGIKFLSIMLGTVTVFQSVALSAYCAQPSVKDNLYKSVNYNFLENSVLPSKCSYYDDDVARNSYFNLLKDYSKSGLSTQSALGKVANVYKTMQDYDARAMVGVSPLDTYFEKIATINSFEDFTSTCAWLVKNGINVFNIKYLFENGAQTVKLVDFNLDIYYPSNYNSNYQAYIERLFSLLSYGNTHEDIDQAIGMERSVAKYSNTNHYNEVKGQDYQRLLSESKGSNSLANTLSKEFTSQLNVRCNLVVDDDLRCQMQSIKSYNINYCKNFLRSLVLRNCAPFLDKNTSIAWADHKQYDGLTQEAIDTKILQANIGFDRIYGKGLSENVSSSDKNFVNGIFKDVREQYIKDLKTINIQAEDQLVKYFNDIKISFGVPIDLQGGVGLPDLSSNIFVVNMLNCNAYNTAVCIAKSNQGQAFNYDQEKIYVLLCVDSNLAYDSLYHCIIVSPVIFNSSRYNSSLPEKTKWLNMAFTIGHETGHCIDSRNVLNLAKKYNLSTSDVNTLSATFAPISQQVSDYSVFISGKAYHMNPTRVLFEAVADYYGAKIVIELIKNNSNFTLQDFFESYAKMRRSIETDEKLKSIIEKELHPVNEFRVNNTLSNFQELYDTYGIGVNNSMYIDSEKRAK